MAEPPITVAVCTNRAAAAIEPTLAAVGRQVGEREGVSGLVVGSGVSSAAADELRSAAERHGLEYADARPGGLSRARNAAVALAPAEGVVAFLDDDAVPAEDWLRNLAAHWDAAGPDVATVGGAIVPRWLASPPSWYSPEIDVVFSLLDRGPGTRPLQPGVEDAWGANVSFRVAAVSEAGGFDPELGPQPGIPMFGDETELQLRLAACGYRGIYAGDVRVEHLVDGSRLNVRELLRRRYYGGASMRIVGSWTPRDGAARLIAGAATLPVALATRRRPAAGVALARIGSGAGVLAAPLVRRRMAVLARAGT